MKCKEIEQACELYLAGALNSEELAQLRLHVATCQTCKKQYDEVVVLERVLNTVPEEAPSEQLQQRFEHFLAAELATSTSTPTSKIIAISKPTWNFKNIAASIALVIGSFLLGKYQHTVSTSSVKTSAIASAEQRFFADINSASPSKRLSAAQAAIQFNQEHPKIIDAIIAKLFHEENVNVRLAAAESLRKFSALERVKTALLKALTTEETAIIQIELIQILTDIKETRALPSMKKLFENQQTPNLVKQELQYGMANLM